MHIVSFTFSFWAVILFLLAGGFASYALGKLTLSASVTGVLTALLIFGGAGLTGVVMMAVFFASGTAATSYKKEYKVKMGLARSDEGKRKTSQVLANAGVAAILALLSILVDYNLAILQVMIAGSLASATGDTLSSELGNLYGRNFYNIATLKKDSRGLNGVISLEGTLFGVLGSVIIALIYTIAHGWSFAFVAIVVAGVAGNIFDSLLGSLFERKRYLGNDAVNFLNTAFAATVALLLMQ
jgi:uncharacterized protein (TIGR00297 family)